MTIKGILCIILALGLLVAPLAVLAQPPSRIPVVGVLVPQRATDPTAAGARQAFEQGLAELRLPAVRRAGRDRNVGGAADPAR